MAEKVEIECRCVECFHYTSQGEGWGYCYYWKYEQGETPNDVMATDFCSEARKS